MPGLGPGLMGEPPSLVDVMRFRNDKQRGQSKELEKTANDHPARELLRGFERCNNESV